MSTPDYSIRKGIDAMRNPCVTDEDRGWREAMNGFFGFVDSDYEPPTAEGVFSDAAYARRKAAERGVQP